MIACLNKASVSSPVIRRLRRNSLSTRTYRRSLRCATRAALAPRYAPNGVIPTRMAVKPIARLLLPQSLPRPALCEVDSASITAAYPELAGITPDYIRERLPLRGRQMLAAVANVRACPPKSSLPKELEIVMNDTVAASCPTHMLAVHSKPPIPYEKCKVSLFPVHHLVLAAHCSNLPVLPSSTPDATSASTTLPVVPMCLPSAETFPILQSYLYTKNSDALLTTLLPSSNNIIALRTITGVWQNACALGVVDEALFDVIDAAWGSVLLEREKRV